MADTSAQTLPVGQRSSRRPHPVVWLAVLAVALGLLGAAIWWVGGPAQALSVLGLDWAAAPFQTGGPGGSGAKPTAAGSVEATGATPAATTLPSSAQERMFSEQVASRATLQELIGGKIHSFQLGKAAVTGDSAKVPVTATLSTGSEISGAITFAKFGSAWYFFSIARDSGKSDRDRSGTHSFDSGVVATMAQAQAGAETQKVITDGILGGGFNEIVVNSIQTGPRTATLDVTLSGGTAAEARGRLVCISKTEADKTYWFLASFEKR
jgi:hypothetical protein